MAAPEEETFVTVYHVQPIARARKGAAQPDSSGNSPAVISDELLSSSSGNSPAVISDEHEKLSIEIDRGESSRPPDAIDQWLQSIKQAPASNQGQKCRIQKVPETLREIKSNKNCYEPHMVSIGPYHLGKPKLKEMQKVKVLMARDYIWNCDNTGSSSVRKLYDKVAEVAVQARQCYAEDATADLNDVAFTQMMFLDGCFILQFFICLFEENRDDDVKMRSLDNPLVLRDLFLLENQLPFVVLKQLMSWSLEEKYWLKKIKSFLIRRWSLKKVSKNSQAWLKKIKSFLIGRWSLKEVSENSQNQPAGKEEPAHLLDLLRAQLINSNGQNIDTQSSTSDSSSYSSTSNNSSNSSTSDNSSNSSTSDNSPHSFRSVKDMKKVGVNFRPSKTGRFTDISFKQHLFAGCLELHPVIVDDYTKSILLNLVAYEACLGTDDDLQITAYICFMDALIDHAEDVTELRSSGILFNLLGNDQKVADLFNEIAENLVGNDFYRVVQHKIDHHQNSKIRVWMAEWLHDHFSSPWTVLAFIGAIVAIGLSITETYFAIKS
ncbi:UPF0481 protein At3g47200-like [Malania oleifera]|uniref:UPF0481 protein At3g47200-like n=1 Tax=Malania oleifera TaxID=397392 RepID=UPI0025ADA5A9|nr:UPF0481 protein At3g47200-like [Malania oleifera]XP_057964442.1 UPF0481 protein At3g47200-like [Malania oleifera]